MARSKYGVTSIFASEFALSVQTNPNVMDVFELVSTLYDSGTSKAPSFKTEDSRETSVSDAYINLLGVTSAAPFYERG